MDRIRRMPGFTDSVRKDLFTFGVYVTCMKQFGRWPMASLRFC